MKRPQSLEGKLFAFLGMLSISFLPSFFVIVFAIATAVKAAVRLKQFLGLSTPMYLLGAYALEMGGALLLVRLSVWLSGCTLDYEKEEWVRWYACLAHFALAATLCVFCLYCL